MNDYSIQDNKNIASTVISTALIVGVAVVLGYSLIRAVTIKISNQDIMLCKSAKVSGNTAYLNRCECFYRTNNITCLQK